jgi:Skp family chaperone for outer membrane proteins
MVRRKKGLGIMKNNIWFVVACVLVFCVGYNLNDVAISFPRYKVAVIDISEVMSKSTELQELKRAQDKDMEELNILISKAQNELINEQNRTKFVQKEAEYRKQIETKKKDIDKKYSTKFVKINDNIKNLIVKEAKKANYNLVLPTGMVISGGEDITESVVKNMK